MNIDIWLITFKERDGHQGVLCAYDSVEKAQYAVARLSKANPNVQYEYEVIELW